MSGMSLVEIYRREADRLRSMADAFVYYEARDDFLDMARRFDRLAHLAERQAPKPAEPSCSLAPREA